VSKRGLAIAPVVLVGCGGVLAAPQHDAGTHQDAAIVEDAAPQKDAAPAIDAGPVLDGKVPSQCNTVPQVAQPVPWAQVATSQPPWPGANGALPLGYFVLVDAKNYDGQQGSLGTVEETIHITASNGQFQFEVDHVYPMPSAPPDGWTYVGAESDAGTLSMTMACPGTDASTWLYRIDGAGDLVMRLGNTDLTYAAY
jgi:hypothetical protein